MRKFEASNERIFRARNVSEARGNLLHPGKFARHRALLFRPGSTRDIERLLFESQLAPSVLRQRPEPRESSCFGGEQGRETKRFSGFRRASDGERVAPSANATATRQSSFEEGSKI